MLGNSNPFLGYCVPIAKLPNELSHRLYNKQSMAELTSKFVNFVINDMRNICKNVPAKALLPVAENLLREFPYSFGIIGEDKKPLSFEPVTLYEKLKQHQHYLNKNDMRNANSKKITKPSILKKKIRCDAGYENWLPTDTPVDDQKRLWLKNHKDDHLSAQVEEYIRETFSQQRSFLVNLESPSIAQIEEMWPHLMVPKYLQLHMNLLFGNVIDVQNNFGQVRQKINQKWIPKLRHQNQLTDDIEIFNFIAARFPKEKLKSFIVKFQVMTLFISLFYYQLIVFILLFKDGYRNK
jgi:hypothetical protein